jgi:acyl carrier protein
MNTTIKSEHYEAITVSLVGETSDHVCISSGPDNEFVCHIDEIHDIQQALGRFVPQHLLTPEQPSICVATPGGISEAAFLAVVAEHIGWDVDDVNMDLDLGQLGMDSLDIVEIDLILEQEFRVTLPEESISNKNTKLREIWHALNIQQATK